MKQIFDDNFRLRESYGLGDRLVSCFLATILTVAFSGIIFALVLLAIGLFQAMVENSIPTWIFWVGLSILGLIATFWFFFERNDS